MGNGDLGMQPDMIYFDEHAGNSQIDLGVRMGLGFLAPTLIANYYNKSLKWNLGKMDVVLNLKGVGGRYNSFQNSLELLPFVDRALVKSTEKIIEPEIMAYPFQTETSIAEWHYLTGHPYMSAKKVIEILMENVSRNGTMLLNLTQHDRGELDPEVVRIAKDIGAWLRVNGEAVYGSRPFELCTENNIRFTRNNGHVYATGASSGPGYGQSLRYVLFTGMNKKLASEKDLKANYWADRVEKCFALDAEFTKDYNLNVSGGKWDHIMDQAHIGYTSWDEPREENIMPKVTRISPEEAKQGGYIFYEKNGVVVMEAEHYFQANATDNTKWTVIPELGRTLSGIALMPYTRKTENAGKSL